MSTTRRTKASPFWQLLGMPQPKLPATPKCTVVVAGKPVTDVRQIKQALVAGAADERDDDQAVAEARRLAEHVRKAKKRAADAAFRAKPEGQARRQAWLAEHREALCAYKKNWRERQDKQALAKQAAQAFQRRWHADLEASRAKARDYYHRNKDRIKARAQERKQAAAGGTGEAQS
ncbi:MAG: hypothetical protein RL375_3396 [Pseudomonadota bacterium]|jgi:hypothetical protein